MNWDEARKLMEQGSKLYRVNLRLNKAIKCHYRMTRKMKNGFDRHGYSLQVRAYKYVNCTFSTEFLDCNWYETFKEAKANSDGVYK